jgi:NADH-quinone oxidoreductase subunit B
MAVEHSHILPDYSPDEVDRAEGMTINQTKIDSADVIADPDQWLLENELKHNIILTRLEDLINWGQRSALWTAICFPACCAFEFIAANGPRFDMSRFGMEILRASPRQADLMITAGTLTWKMAPTVKRIYNQMAEPKWVIAMGACGVSGGIFRSSYNVVPGYNHIVPVDVYVPGCPPRPEGLIYGIQMLQDKIKKKCDFPSTSGTSQTGRTGGAK